jgi:hypothetical protein
LLIIVLVNPWFFRKGFQYLFDVSRCFQCRRS